MFDVFRTFAEFEDGFGIVSQEHWLGVRYQHLMTKDKKSCRFIALLDVDLGSWNNWQNSSCGLHPSDCNGQVRI